MTRSLLVAAALAAALPHALHAQAPDPNLGRNLAANCANCHGTNGRSVGGMAGLAGRPRDQITQMLRDFREGTRPATIMHQISKGYTDAQIDAIAAYLSSQKP
jgi:cytochrome c553